MSSPSCYRIFGYGTPIIFWSYLLFLRPSNSLNLSANKIRVGISSAFGAGVHAQIGNTISQQGSNATGKLVSTAGIATGDLTVSRAGIGYTPASGNRGLIGIALSTITGSGRDATANVHFDGGVAVAATIASGGEGYSVGDVLGISTNLGINASGAIWWPNL